MNFTPDKQDKKDHILDVAERLFAEKGYEGASTRLIGKEANVNMAMLNYYFGSKEGLFKEVLGRRLSNFRQTLTVLNEQEISSWQKLDQCIDLYVERIMKSNCFHKLIHRELSINQRSELRDFVVDSILLNAQQVSRILQEGIDKKEFREVDVNFTVATFFGTQYYMVSSTAIASRLLERDLSDPAVMEEIKPQMKAHLRDILTAHLKRYDSEA